MAYPPDRPTGLATATPEIGSNDLTLPEGVIGRIFNFSIQGPVILPPPRDDARRVLTQVCAKWRGIVVSTTTFWSSFNFTQLEVQRPNNLFRLAALFFHRSGETAPLSVHLGGPLQSGLGIILGLIIRPRAHRVWFLSCTLTKSQLRTIFGPHVHFPLLQFIDVRIVCDSDGSIASRISVKGSIDLSGLQNTPSLQHATLRILDGVHPTDLRLPWARLTRIDLGHTSTQVGAFVKILEQSLVLEDGVFLVNFTRSYDGQPTTLRRISVPHLRRLRLRLFQPSQDTRVFGNLEMHDLEELWFEREELRQPIRDMAIYERFLGGLNATLKHITIAEYLTPTPRWFTPRLDCKPRFTYQDMDGVLRLARNLTSLYLCPKVFLHPLVLEKMATGELLPVLAKLGVSSISGWDIIWMIQRKNTASALPRCGPSSYLASLVERTAHPVALDYLCICTMEYELGNDNIQKLEEAIRALRLLNGYSIRHIDNTTQGAHPLHSILTKSLVG